MKERLVLLSMALLLLQGKAFAQELEYKMELGGALGGCFYLGDVNSTPFRNLGGAGGVVVRYIFNPRMAVKGNLLMGHIYGDTGTDFFPLDPDSETPEGGIPARVAFKRNVFDLGAQFEYNFWAYGSGLDYKDSHRLTPYLLLGFGFTFAPKPEKVVFGVNFPIGAGLKYKLGKRINVGLEWSIRFTTSDALDVSDSKGMSLDSPFGIKGSGFKNKDCYSYTLLYMTYDLFPKYRKCNN